MKLLDIKQNTPEWLSLRRTKIGASDCAGILLKNPYITPRKIYIQKILGIQEPINEDMQRGQDLEPEAREWISKQHGKNYQTQCLQSEERDWQIASLDCFFGEGDASFGGEIKVPREKRLKEIEKKGIPESWKWQMQHQMSVTGHRHMFLLAYSPEKQVVKWLPRDEDMIAHLNAKEAEFYYDYLTAFIEPCMSPHETEEAELLAKLGLIA